MSRSLATLVTTPLHAAEARSRSLARSTALAATAKLEAEEELSAVLALVPERSMARYRSCRVPGADDGVDAPSARLVVALAGVALG